MTFKIKAMIIGLGACIAAPAIAHDLSIPAIGNQGFLARMGGSYAKDKIIEYMFDMSKAPSNGTDVVDAGPSLARQIANVLTGINVGVTLWTLGSMGLKKSLELASKDDLALFDKIYGSGMDMYVLMTAAQDNYKAIRAILDEVQTPQITNGTQPTALQTYVGNSVIPAYVTTGLAGGLASYYSFALGAKAGSKISQNPLVFSLVMWNIGITLCMASHEAYKALAEKIGLTNGYKAIDAIYAAAEQNAYVITGIIPGLYQLWKFNREHTKKFA